VRIVVALSAIVLVVVAATWVYRVNYQTQAALDRVAAVRAEIDARREALSVLRAEWAYVNRPDWLHALAAPHAEALGLGRLAPEQFAEVSEIPFPPPAEPELPADGDKP
jgi:hypothetical protein